MTRMLIFHMVLKKFIELITNKPVFSQCNIFYKYNFFFLIIAKKVNQIKNNKACIVARLGFVFCYALTTGRYNDFQDVFVNQKKSEFYSP